MYHENTNILVGIQVGKFINSNRLTKPIGHNFILYRRRFYVGIGIHRFFQQFSFCPAISTLTPIDCPWWRSGIDDFYPFFLLPTLTSPIQLRSSPRKTLESTHNSYI